VVVGTGVPAAVAATDAIIADVHTISPGDDGLVDETSPRLVHVPTSGSAPNCPLIAASGRARRADLLSVRGSTVRSLVATATTMHTGNDENALLAGGVGCGPLMSFPWVRCFAR
jgi:hypothetical protein